MSTTVYRADNAGPYTDSYNSNLTFKIPGYGVVDMNGGKLVLSTTVTVDDPGVVYPIYVLPAISFINNCRIAKGDGSFISANPYRNVYQSNVNLYLTDQERAEADQVFGSTPSMRLGPATLNKLYQSDFRRYIRPIAYGTLASLQGASGDLKVDLKVPLPQMDNLFNGFRSFPLKAFGGLNISVDLETQTPLFQDLTDQTNRAVDDMPIAAANRAIIYLTATALDPLYTTLTMFESIPFYLQQPVTIGYTPAGGAPANLDTIITDLQVLPLNAVNNPGQLQITLRDALPAAAGNIFGAMEIVARPAAAAISWSISDAAIQLTRLPIPTKAEDALISKLAATEIPFFSYEIFQKDMPDVGANGRFQFTADLTPGTVSVLALPIDAGVVLIADRNHAASYRWKVNNDYSTSLKVLIPSDRTIPQSQYQDRIIKFFTNLNMRVTALAFQDDNGAPPVDQVIYGQVIPMSDEIQHFTLEIYSDGVGMDARSVLVFKTRQKTLKFGSGGVQVMG